MSIRRTAKSAVLAALSLAGLGLVLSCGSGPPGSPSKPGPEENNLKVVVVGLDAATWEAAQPLMMAGRLPSFMRLVSEGATGVLWSQEPTITACIWTTIATGFNREKHGILNFAVPGTDPPAPYTSNMWERRAIWNILSDHKRTVGIVNWWVTYPAERVDGYMVSNYSRYFYPLMLAEKKSFTAILPEIKDAVFPPGIANEILSLEVPPVEQATGIDFSVIGKHTINIPPDANFGLTFKQGGYFFKKMMEQEEFVKTLGLRLYQEQPVDFFAMYLESIDVSCHLFWAYAHPASHAVSLSEIVDLGGIVGSAYEYCDRTLGEFMAKLDPRTVLVVCSDHGYGTLSPTLHSHKPNGLIAFFGEPVRKGFHLPGMSVTDVTPTILTLMGLPAAADMDGKPVTDFLKEPYLSRTPRETVATYEVKSPAPSRTPVVSPVDRELIKQLKALGYLK
jgi:predicted AlkP superfamily phosphohydrolase/phosphomutase